MRDGGWHGKLVPLVARGDLPGLSDPASLERFVECIEQSLIDHAAIRAGKNLPKATRGPGPEFEPFAEIKRLAEDDWHEAIWLAALATAVGWDRPESIGQLRRGMYQGEPWTWTRVVADGGREMAHWIDANSEELHQVAKFGDHRAYQSHRATSPTSTGKVVASLAGWLESSWSELHPNTIDFDRLYHSMEPAVGFGRTARFDFLRLVGLLGLAPIEPEKCYFEASSGPQRGARLLFGLPDAGPVELERRAAGLCHALGVSAQIAEDTCCQWQKGH